MSPYGLFMTELPMFDERGGSLVSFVRLDSALPEEMYGSQPPACSLIVVEWDQQVLLGFNVSRQQWELPGGAVEAGESAHERHFENYEKKPASGRRGHAGRAGRFLFDGATTRYLAAVFTVVLDGAPD